MKRLKKHGRRIGVILLNSIVGWNWFLNLIGFVNKYLLKRSIRGVFLLYPANKKYTEAYVYHWYAKTMKWSPRLVCFLDKH